MTFERRTVLDVLLLPVGSLAFALLCWWAVYAGPQAADKFEARLERAARAALSGQDYEWAQIQLDGQTAVLSGTAPTTELRNRAIQRVLTASGAGGGFWGGVRRVQDRTEIQPPLTFWHFGASRDVSTIRLYGYLPGPDARDRMLDLLKNAGFGPEAVVDDTRFADGLPEGDWLGAADLGVSQLIRLTRGELDFDNKRIILHGQATDQTILQSVTQKLTRPPSGYTADVRLTGSAIWSAVLSGDHLTLSGALPDASDRTRLASLAGELFDGQIDNEMVIAPMPSRDWVTGVITAFPNFIYFQEGRLAYTGDELLIEGRAPASVLDFMREDIVSAGALVNFKLTATPSPIELKALASLSEGEIADHETCQAALDEALALGPVSFRKAGDDPERESGPVLDGVLTTAQACPDEVFIVSAFTHVNGRSIATLQLTEARQRAFSDYFIARGVPLNQFELTNVETGRSAPDTGGGDQNDRQISVRLRE